MLKYFTEESKVLLKSAMRFAEVRRSPVISAVDLIEALADDESSAEFHILCSLGLSQPSLRTGSSEKMKTLIRENLEFSKEVKDAIKLASEVAPNRQGPRIRPRDLVFGLIKQWLIGESSWPKSNPARREEVITRLILSHIASVNTAHEAATDQPVEKMRHLVSQMNKLSTLMSLQLTELEREESRH